MKKHITINDKEYSFNLLNQTNDKIHFEFQGSEYTYWIGHKGENVSLVSRYDNDVIGHAFNLDITELKQVFVGNKEVTAKIKGKTQGKSQSMALTEGSVQSPMPGKIFKVLKEVGAAVKAGEAVMIMEAMKMEHTICAGKDGVIREILFNEGDQVQGGVLLCEIE